MDNNYKHTTERALQEQFCLEKIQRMVVPFFPHTLMAACIAGKVANQEEVMQERGGIWGKVGHSKQLLIIVKMEEIR